MKNHLLLASLLGTGLFFTGCQKALDDVAVQSVASVADGKKVPTSYQAVNIDLIRVEVSQDNNDNTSNWTTLAGVQPGLRDLLQTGSSNSPLLTSSGFQTGTVKQLRLVLGAGSTIVLANGQVLPLDTPSGQTSGLKVKVNQATSSGVPYSVLIAIDADRQVVARGNGTYGLKPVLDGTLIIGAGRERNSGQ
ncbi:DUF4382 domain-containing protein [Hymenobacter algoricola]|uniref:DUF4382 domain-containing protein n=1 Tax=Hymenobacter algoricola TaxID=486267 RepID=A0ABP7N6T7_9BACT